MMSGLHLVIGSKLATWEWRMGAVVHPDIEEIEQRARQEVNDALEHARTCIAHLRNSPDDHEFIWETAIDKAINLMFSIEEEVIAAYRENGIVPPVTYEAVVHLPWTKSKAKAHSVTKKPASMTKKPASVTKKPASVTKKPASMSNKPASVTKKLHTLTVKHASSGEQLEEWGPSSVTTKSRSSMTKLPA